MAKHHPLLHTLFHSLATLGYIPFALSTAFFASSSPFVDISPIAVLLLCFIPPLTIFPILCFSYRYLERFSAISLTVHRAKAYVMLAGSGLCLLLAVHVVVVHLAGYDLGGKSYLANNDTFVVGGLAAGGGEGYNNNGMLLKHGKEQQNIVGGSSSPPQRNSGSKILENLRTHHQTTSASSSSSSSSSATQGNTLLRLNPDLVANTAGEKDGSGSSSTGSLKTGIQSWLPGFPSSLVTVLNLEKLKQEKEAKERMNFSSPPLTPPPAADVVLVQHVEQEQEQQQQPQEKLPQNEPQSRIIPTAETPETHPGEQPPQSQEVQTRQFQKRQQELAIAIPPQNLDSLQQPGTSDQTATEEQIHQTKERFHKSRQPIQVGPISGPDENYIKNPVPQIGRRDEAQTREGQDLSEITLPASASSSPQSPSPEIVVDVPASPAPLAPAIAVPAVPGLVAPTVVMSPLIQPFGSGSQSNEPLIAMTPHAPVPPPPAFVPPLSSASDSNSSTASHPFGSLVSKNSIFGFDLPTLHFSLFIISQLFSISLLATFFLGILIITEWVLDREDEDLLRYKTMYWCRVVGITIATVTSAVHGSVLSGFVLLDIQNSDWIARVAVGATVFYWCAIIPIVNRITSTASPDATTAF